MARPNLNDIHQLTQTTVINESTAATNEIVVAAAGKKIVVTNIVLVCSAANTVNWEDGTTDISGVMSFAANGGYSMSGMRLLETTAGNALQLTSGSAEQVSGHISYYLE